MRYSICRQNSKLPKESLELFDIFERKARSMWTWMDAMWKKWIGNVCCFSILVNSQFLRQTPHRLSEMKIHFFWIFTPSSSSSNVQLVVGSRSRRLRKEKESAWFGFARRKKKREALIKHSSLLGRQRYIGKISSLSDEKKLCQLMCEKKIFN